MRKEILSAILAVAGLSMSLMAADANKPAALSLADASGKIAEAIDKPAVMQDVVSKARPTRRSRSI